MQRAPIEPPPSKGIVRQQPRAIEVRERRPLRDREPRRDQDAALEHAADHRQAAVFGPASSHAGGGRETAAFHELDVETVESEETPPEEETQPEIENQGNPQPDNQSTTDDPPARTTVQSGGQPSP